MRKFGVLTATIFLSIILGGLYGIIHDQITYSISPEYFTKFKYQQFGFEPSWFGGHRQTVAVIGFLATWWMGLFIGIMLGLLGLIFKDHIAMRRSITKAIKIVFITAVVFAIIGFLWGKYHLLTTVVDWWMPEDIIDKNNFIVVGSIHNFSYIGGIAGILIAMTCMIRKNVLIKRNAVTKSNISK
jgi:hypothetical protein